MIETPYLGDKYNYFLPGAILVFSVIFLLLSYLRYESAVIALMRRINHGDGSHQMDLVASSSEEATPQEVTSSLTHKSASEAVHDLSETRQSLS